MKDVETVTIDRPAISPPLPKQGASLAERWSIVALLALSLAIHLWGIRKNLPYTPEVDEPIYVTRAVTIASSGYLNPGWFGNPGSTMMYPLAAIYHLWNAAAHGGTWLHPDSELETRFYASPGEFYFLGRLLTIAYAALSVPVIYLVGRRIFGSQVALTGTILWIFYPVAVAYAQMVRTDSAGVFFGMLAFWLCLRLYDKPTIRNHALAGAAIGLSIATRYLMASLVPLLLLIDALLLWQNRACAAKLKLLLFAALIAMLAVVITFAVTTPYFFRDFTTAMSDLKYEARTTHLGADGLSYAGNLLWYMTRAIPASISWGQMLLALAALVLIMYRRTSEPLLMAGFILIFLVCISFSHLHWQRWVIQILPLFALLAAYALNEAVTHLAEHFRANVSLRRALLLCAVLFVTALPAYQVAMYNQRGTGASSRLLARSWIVGNLPNGSHIAQDRYAAPLVSDDFFGHPPERHSGPLPGSGFVVYERYSLAPERTPDDYYHEGYRYLVVSSAMYERYMAEPTRYPSEVNFYQTVFRDGRLIRSFDSSSSRGGFEHTEGHLLQPDVQIYELPER